MKARATHTNEEQGKSAVVLIDYDNVKPNRNERTTNDSADNLIQIREWIATVLPQVPIGVNEVLLRIYGGWIDERGGMTLRGNWVLASLSQVRGLMNGIRYIPGLVTSIAARQVRLRGLYRKNSPDREQKMVDTLMAVDALHYCDADVDVLVIATDDDDLVPAILAASVRGTKTCCLFRPRPKGQGLNDAILETHGVHMIKIGE